MSDSCTPEPDLYVEASCMHSHFCNGRKLTSCFLFIYINEDYVRLPADISVTGSKSMLFNKLKQAVPLRTLLIFLFYKKYFGTLQPYQLLANTSETLNP